MRWFSTRTSPKDELDHQPLSEGLVLFDSAGTVFAAERVLAKAGYGVKAVAPPQELRQGCDLALQINLVEQAGIARCLQESGIPIIDLIPMHGEMKKPLEIVKVVQLGDYTMVRAGNMKLTFHTADSMIVNVSGGGCPDVPYLNRTLVGRSLFEAEPPSATGFTLCALMLQRAFDEAVKLARGEADE